MSEDRTEDRFARRFRDVYRATPPEDSASIERIATAVRSAPRPRAATRGPRAWIAPRRITYRPIAAAAAGVALVAAGALMGIGLGRVGAPAPPPEPATPSVARPGGEEVRFVLEAGPVSKVAVVGDFNDWDASATPMHRDPRNRLWSATIRLAPGWHSYAFVVDGEHWIPDPEAPSAPADDYGTRRSVIVVGESGA